jgi:hypothetical protein
MMEFNCRDVIEAPVGFARLRRVETSTLTHGLNLLSLSYRYIDLRYSLPLPDLKNFSRLIASFIERNFSV